MEILTEFDELQEALKKVNLDESVMPYVNGILVDDVAYNKVQKILDCPEMISAHKYLYNLDLDQLSEEEVDKIDKLYKLGCDRGFIIDDLTKWDDTTPVDDAASSIVKDEQKPVEEKPIAGSLFKAKVPCWTVIYSAASKDGQIKTGEAYSNAISASAAKADVKAKLSSIGYSNITILAIESCEADVEVDNFKTSDTAQDATAETPVDGVAENDMLNGKPHNNHVDEKEESDEESSDDSDSDSSSDSEETSDAGSSDSEEESSDEEDTGSDEESEESDEESDEEESSDDDSTEDSDSEEDEEDELDANEKAELKDKYKKVFKNTLSKCKFETSFNDLTLEQKVKFFTELSKAWKDHEPNEFMTDKEIEQLNNVVVKPETED